MKASAFLVGLALLIAAGCGSKDESSPEAQKTPGADGKVGGGQFNATADPVGGGNSTPTVGMGAPQGDKGR